MLYHWQIYKNENKSIQRIIFYTKHRGLNVPEDGIECESFTVISIDSLLIYENKYYLQVHIEKIAYKIANKQMTDYLDGTLFKD